MELLALHDALARMAEKPAKAHRQNGKVPKDLRVAGPAINAASDQIINARREILGVDVFEKMTIETLTIVSRATDPAKVEKARRNTRDPIKRDALPDVEAARLLHQGATAMIQEARAEAKAKRRTAGYRLRAATTGGGRSRPPRRWTRRRRCEGS